MSVTIKINKRLEFLVLFISGCCLSFLFVQPNLYGLLFMAAGIICCVCLSAAFVKNTSGIVAFNKSSIVSLCSALLIGIFIGGYKGGTAMKYADSELIASLFSKAGLNQSFWLSVINVCLVIAALPILFAFFEYLQSDRQRKGTRQDFYSSKRFFYICFLIGTALCVALLVSCFSYESNVDDAFSLQLVKRDFLRLTELTAKDFHPPLYYYLLKVFLAIFSFTGIDELFLGKIFSVLPYVILLIICLVAYKKNNHKSFSLGITVLLFGSTCCFFTQAMAVRMYTWGLLFVTLTYLAAQNLIKTRGGVIPGIYLHFLP